MTTAAPADNVVKVIVPGRLVALQTQDPENTGETLTAEVFPIGITQLQKFSKELTTIMEQIGPALAVKDLSEEARNQHVMKVLAPIILERGLELVAACTTLSNNAYVMIAKTSEEIELPHYDVAPIVDAWIEENFGDERKLNPWKVVIGNVMSKLPKAKST